MRIPPWVASDKDCGSAFCGLTAASAIAVQSKSDLRVIRSPSPYFSERNAERGSSRRCRCWWDDCAPARRDANDWKAPNTPKLRQKPMKWYDNTFYGRFV